MWGSLINNPDFQDDLMLLCHMDFCEVFFFIVAVGKLPNNL